MGDVKDPLDEFQSMDWSHCDVCGWELADDPEDGCTVGNCSMRPLPQAQHISVSKQALRELIDDYVASRLIASNHRKRIAGLEAEVSVALQSLYTACDHRDAALKDAARASEQVGCLEQKLEEHDSNRPLVGGDPDIESPVALRKRIEKLKGLLRDLEWEAFWGPDCHCSLERICPECGGQKPEHADGCRLAAALEEENDG